ncbi:hypothetical protein PsorP6_004272 [Peronosclerospora sorghi]|uniref:Uncharacterized protein n=1 Tax=Peronosclerospora sorghi TaxID=230839 RepID=A0ACC0VMJ2_9STRA|nr:hypothetical protein PsorP6_004272 [Peronosclerospora sorghi]
MLVQLQGWDDAEVLKLLEIFRKHLLYYIYTSDSDFADVVRTELPEKSGPEIIETTRSLMQQFSLRVSTKNFRTDVIVVNGQEEVYLYKHLYESISQLAENKIGGIWLPDELSRFLLKARQYRGLFPGNQDVYFKRIQVWSKDSHSCIGVGHVYVGKSIAETTRKFYAFRDIYLKENRRRLCQRKGVEPVRFALLKSIFDGVPASPQMERELQVHSKTQKLWSPQELDTLVDFIVRITKQIQKNGHSDLVNHFALHVSATLLLAAFIYLDWSCIHALDLPDIVFDPTSDAYKIFSADWNDVNDSYALGYLAMKARSVKMMTDRNKRRRGKSAWVSRPKPRRLTYTAQETSNSLIIPSVEDVDTANPMARIQSASDSQNKRMNDYAVFVQDVVEQCHQSVKNVAHAVLRHMQESIDLYRSNRLVAFFSKIANLTPDVAYQEVFADAEFILTQFQQRFGSLHGFENLCLTVPGTETTQYEADGQSHACSAQNNPLHRTPYIGTQTGVIAVNAQSNKIPDKVFNMRNSDSNEGDLDPFQHASSAFETAQSGNELHGYAESDSSIPRVTKESQPMTLPSTSNRSEDEQHGMKFIEKRRVNESFTAAFKDNVEDDEDDRKYECYDEAEHDDGHSEDSNSAPSGHAEYCGSDGEPETLDVFQHILYSLESDIAELEERQRKLIERKEERMWRQNNPVD